MKALVTWIIGVTIGSLIVLVLSEFEDGNIKGGIWYSVLALVNVVALAIVGGILK